MAILSRMRFARSPLAPTRARSGLTIIEVLAALMVVSVGLLGMAGAAALSLRTVGEVTRERRALRRLDLRLAGLAAAGCGRAMGGTASDPRDSVHELWTVAAMVAGAALVDARVEWREGAGMRSIAHRSAILC
jgi:prepilin-type N-terminal cleavage/methylation domain-containing protein